MSKLYLYLYLYSLNDLVLGFKHSLINPITQLIQTNSAFIKLKITNTIIIQTNNIHLSQSSFTILLLILFLFDFQLKIKILKHHKQSNKMKMKENIECNCYRIYFKYIRWWFDPVSYHLNGVNYQLQQT